MTTKVVPVRCCSDHRDFNVLFRLVSNTWNVEAVVGGQADPQYHGSTFSGDWAVHPTYPGCPSCGARSVYRCDQCRNLGCWPGPGTTMTCPWCATVARPQVVRSFERLESLPDQQ